MFFLEVKNMESEKLVLVENRDEEDKSWAEEAREDLDNYIEENGVYLRQ